MNNQVNEVLEKIREVCGLKRFIEGCLFYDENAIDWARNLRLIAYNQKNGLAYFAEPDGSVFHCYEKKFSTFKLIGLPVQLNHLLWALGTEEISMICGSDTTHLVLRLNDDYFGYNLQKSVEDNLHSNPELTKWVHEVIVGDVIEE